MAERVNLCTLVVRAEANGHAHMIVTVPRARPPKNTVQLAPGLNARCVGWDGERAIADVRTADARRWLERRGIDPSDPQWSAERAAPVGEAPEAAG